MERNVNSKKYFIPENENIEIFACFPWSGGNNVNNAEANAKRKKNQEISKSNKNVLGICFITDMDGFFKYIHPNFLNLFDGVENQFYETSVLDKDASIGSQSILKYLVAMIQKGTSRSFLKNRFSKCIDKFHKLEWKMSYNRGLLYFSLDEEDVVSIKEGSGINTELSLEQILTKEIQKLYLKIEHAKMFHANQIGANEQAGNNGFEEAL